MQIWKDNRFQHNEVLAFASDPVKLPECGEGILDTRVTSDQPTGVATTYVIKNKVMGGEQEIASLMMRFTEQPHHNSLLRLKEIIEGESAG
jgi:hypothetical protein